jgi:hypothetical protein
MSADLRELMQERSTIDASVAGAVRLGQIRQRIARIRRRRQVTAVAGLAVVVLAGAALANLAPGRGAPPEPAGPAADLIDGFPEYDAGGRVVATEVAHFPERTLSLTLVPTTLNLLIATRCEPSSVSIEVAANGHTMFSGGCGETPSMHRFGDDATQMYQGYGLEIGRPATFTITVAGPLPAEGEYALAVAEAVPFADYPLPPRPEVLFPLTLDNGNRSDRPVQARLDSVPGNPLVPVALTVIYRDGLEGQIAAQTPGFLRVSVNGTPVVTHQAWNYLAEPMTFWFEVPDIPEGTTVTVTVEPEHVTGAWALIVID